MKLRPSSIALLTVALVLAAGSALVARNLMRRPAPPKVVVKQQKLPDPTFVLTAATTINPGDFIDGRAVQWAERPEHDVHAGEVIGRTTESRRKQEQALFGSTVRQTFEAGDSISANLLLSPGSPGFISAVLSPGMRAISIPTSAVTSNAGLVSAGDWVDVILSVERDEAAEMSVDSGGLAQANLAAQTILRRIRVLALNSDTQSLAPISVVTTDGQEVASAKKKKTQSKRRKVYETITLEVTPEEAERLAVAREAGSLQVVLRSMKATAEAGEEEKTQVTRLQDATAIFVVKKKSKSVSKVQTFHGTKAGAVSF